MSIEIESYKFIDVLIPELVDQGKSLFMVGDSRRGKTFLVRKILQALGRDAKPIVVNPYRRSDYRGLGFRVSFSHSLLRDEWITYWQERMIRNRILILEDLARLLSDPEITKTVIGKIQALISQRRYILFSVSQNMRRMKQILKPFDLIVFFQLSDKTNMKIATGVDNFNLVSKEIDDLDRREYLIIEPSKRLISKAYSNDNPVPVVKALWKGVNGRNYAFRKKERERLRGKPKIRQVWEMVIENQELTYPQIAKKTEIKSRQQVGNYICILRDRGLLPSSAKKLWKQQEIEKCQERAYDYWGY